jgi:hypothetical protein
MRVVQLDKNAGGKDLRDACNRQGKVRCVLLPRRVRDTATDPEVVELGAKNRRLTLTFDKGFFASASHRLAGDHSGVLLLREDDGSLRQMSTRTAPAFLTNFKDDFGDEWHSIPWNNCVVELTPTLIYLYYTRTSPSTKVMVKRDERGWQDKLRSYLRENAKMLPKRP